MDRQEYRRQRDGALRPDWRAAAAISARLVDEPMDPETRVHMLGVYRATTPGGG